MSQVPYGTEQRDMVDDDAAAEMDAGSDSEEIEVQRAQVEQTRSELSSTIDAIKEKLSPDHLMEEAKEKVREATVGRAQEVAGRAQEAVGAAMEKAQEVVEVAVDRARGAVDTARDAMSSAGERVQRAGSNFTDTIRANPVPVALIGIGLGWLIFSALRENGSRQDRDYDYDYSGYGDRPYAEPAQEGGVGETLSETGQRVGETAGAARARVGEIAGQVRERAGEITGQVRNRAGEIAGSVREKAGELAGRAQTRASLLRLEARDQIERAGDTFQRTLQDNPLALGAVAMGLGATVALLIPVTEREQRVMGEARDRLVEKAQDTAQNVAERVRNVAQQAVETVKQEAASGS